MRGSYQGRKNHINIKEFPGWLVLILLSLVSVAVRHYFNVRKVMRSLWWILPAAFGAMLLIMWFTAPRVDRGAAEGEVDMDAVMSVVQLRCTGCHSDSPTQPGFCADTLGSETRIVRFAPRHHC